MLGWGLTIAIGVSEITALWQSTPRHMMIANNECSMSASGDSGPCILLPKTELIKAHIWVLTTSLDLASAS